MKKFPILFSLLLMISGCATQLPNETENTKEKIEKLEKQAESGDAKALNHLGEIYHFGEGAKQDFGKAFDYYKKAVEKGSAQAANHLGRMYSNGEGVEQSRGEAKKWYKKSVELDPSDLNTCINGEHKNRAFASLQILATQGIPIVQYELAQIYSTGTDFVPANPKEAMKWYFKAAEGGDPYACLQLYSAYKKGAPLSGIEKDVEEAEKWRKKAEALNVEPLYLKCWLKYCIEN